MKVLGISCSPRKDHTTDQLVKEMLGAVEVETEFISLAGLNIGSCIALMGVELNSEARVAKHIQWAGTFYVSDIFIGDSKKEN